MKDIFALRLSAVTASPDQTGIDLEIWCLPN